MKRSRFSEEQYGVQQAVRRGHRAAAFLCLSRYCDRSRVALNANYFASRPYQSLCQHRDITNAGI
jgi:hypothetical protein